MSWQDKVEKKQRDRETAIEAWGLQAPQRLHQSNKTVKYLPRQGGLLTDEEISITESPPTTILGYIKARIWTSEQVLKAFVARAVIAHHLTNPLTEVFFDQGLRRAKVLDAIQRDTGEVVGPLHGLPISLKDTLHMKGLDSTMGFAALIGNPQQGDDTIVQMLREAGAVFYCKTNVPQGLMSGECFNYVFGRTKSAWNTDLSAGGSSGGEGSLVSLGGSPLGVGGDIAGSIRTPANFNGIYGLTPSVGRFPAHRADKVGGDSFIRAVYGPLARGVDGLELYARTILSMKPWERDHQVLRIPWRQSEYEDGLGLRHRLSFAFMHHDNVVIPDPPIQRCMKEIRRKLESAGHDIIDIDPFDGKEIADVMFSIFGATGGKDIHDVVGSSGEPLIEELEFTSTESGLSAWEYKSTGARLYLLRQKYQELITATARKTRSGQLVDAIILPSGGHVAPPHSTMEYYTYEAISNVLDWTCATIPVGFVDEALDHKPEVYQPISEADRRNHAKYSPEAYKHAPVCLQLMGLRHCEEKVLGLLRTVDAALGRGSEYLA